MSDSYYTLTLMERIADALERIADTLEDDDEED